MLALGEKLQDRITVSRLLTLLPWFEEGCFVRIVEDQNPVTTFILEPILNTWEFVAFCIRVGLDVLVEYHIISFAKTIHTACTDPEH
jgi:hypothetical protein